MAERSEKCPVKGCPGRVEYDSNGQGSVTGRCACCGAIIQAQGVAETNRLTSLSYASNPKMLDLEIAKALAGLCGKATTCVIGASPNALLGLKP